MTDLKLFQLAQNKIDYPQKFNKIIKEKKRKTTQYIGEGVTFFLLIITCAIIVYRAVHRQFRQTRDQQNFMMAITHELKTPIAITKLNLETLQKHSLLKEQQQRLILNTLQEANRLNDLCNNLLLSSQMEAGGYQVINEEINLTEMVNNCAHDFITRFPQRNIITNLQQRIYFTGDRLLLQMALNNLLDNAIKYSARETTIFINLKNQNNKINLSIKDEGKGIPDEEKEKVFNKFYRVGNQYTKGSKGTGLGLYVTKKIVQQHKGDITVTNNNPHGSIFEIII